MKIFKWYLIDDIDKMCLENGKIRLLENIKRINEERIWKNILLRGKDND